MLLRHLLCMLGEDDRCNRAERWSLYRRLLAGLCLRHFPCTRVLEPAILLTYTPTGADSLFCALFYGPLLNFCALPCYSLWALLKRFVERN